MNRWLINIFVAYNINSDYFSSFLAVVEVVDTFNIHFYFEVEELLIKLNFELPLLYSIAELGSAFVLFFFSSLFVDLKFYTFGLQLEPHYIHMRAYNIYVCCSNLLFLTK